MYAHKPSLNVVPLRGWFPSPPGGPPQLPETLSVAGPIARGAKDLLLAMQIMGGPDERGGLGVSLVDAGTATATPMGLSRRFCAR